MKEPAREHPEKLLQCGEMLSMPEIAISEFIEHIEDDDFPLRYGNPVVINCDNGKNLVCLSWKFYERMMMLSGRGDELDKLNRLIADKPVD